jgi:hypothetical protein
MSFSWIATVNMAQLPIVADFILSNMRNGSLLKVKSYRDDNADVKGDIETQSL